MPSSVTNRLRCRPWYVRGWIRYDACQARPPVTRFSRTPATTSSAATPAVRTEAVIGGTPLARRPDRIAPNPWVRIASESEMPHRYRVQATDRDTHTRQPRNPAHGAGDHNPPSTTPTKAMPAAVYQVTSRCEGVNPGVARPASVCRSEWHPLPPPHTIRPSGPALRWQSPRYRLRSSDSACPIHPRSRTGAEWASPETVEGLL
jgi:hypothetical protein